jgi:hypothetical protein
LCLFLCACQTPDPFDSSALPGAVDDPDGPAALFKRGGEGSTSSAGGGAAAQDDAGGAAGDKGAASDAASGSVATTNTANDTGIVSDYGRGKRLRKLMRLLSSKAALQVVVSFRFRVVLLVAAICIVHLGAFGALLAFISKQDSMLDNVEAAGDVVDLVHRIAGLAVVLDAAGRGYGFAAADLPKYAAEMEYNYNRCDWDTMMIHHKACSLNSTTYCQRFAFLELNVMTDEILRLGAGIMLLLGDASCRCYACTAGQNMVYAWH